MASMKLEVKSPDKFDTQVLDHQCALRIPSRIMASRLIKPATAREETASERASTRVCRPKRKEVRKTWLRWDNSSSCSAPG